MNKKIISFLAAVTVFFALLPAVYANTFVNEAFAGSYLSAGATNDNYAKLDILKCNDSSISLTFKFVKNGKEQLIYECYEGTMNDTQGVLRFKVSYQDGTYVSDGTMDISLDSWCVKLECNSDQGQHLFDGIMYPQFTLDPYNMPTTSPEFTDPTPSVPSSGVTVKLNNETVTFPNNINPVIINDYTYVPLRSVFDMMGINVYWDEYQKTDILKAQSITCTKNDTIVQFLRTFNDTGYNAWSLSKWEGENTSSTNKTDIMISDVQPEIIGSSSYIPLRVVSESFGADVNWDGETKTVLITCDTSNAYKYDTETIGKLEDYSLDIAKSYVTSDFTSVIPDTTPYYSNNSKFYLFKAKDQWGDVQLTIYYGQYIDVTAINTPADNDTPTVEPENTDDKTSETDDITTEQTEDETTSDATSETVSE